MGFIRSSKVVSKTDILTKTSGKDLYKPIENFGWKEASKEEREKFTIKAYSNLAY
mgnify:CR=1 FL=1